MPVVVALFWAYMSPALTGLGEAIVRAMVPIVLGVAGVFVVLFVLTLLVAAAVIAIHRDRTA